jgi:hypothetical protein
MPTTTKQTETGTSSASNSSTSGPSSYILTQATSTLIETSKASVDFTSNLASVRANQVATAVTTFSGTLKEEYQKLLPPGVTCNSLGDMTGLSNLTASSLTPIMDDTKIKDLMAGDLYILTVNYNINDSVTPANNKIVTKEFVYKVV